MGRNNLGEIIGVSRGRYDELARRISNLIDGYSIPYGVKAIYSESLKPEYTTEEKYLLGIMAGVLIQMTFDTPVEHHIEQYIP